MPPNRLLLVVNSLLLLLVIAIGVLSRPAQVVPGSASVAVTPPSTAPVPFTPKSQTAVPPAEAPIPQTPVTQAPQPVPVPSYAAAPQGVAPATAEDVAREFGGSPSQWLKRDEFGRTVGDNGWILRTHGQTRVQFTVPAGCVVDTSTGRLYAGASVDVTDLTIYWV